MGFTELTIKDLYVTDSDDIPEEFYGIALPKTVLYKRAAGFFSSSALATLGRGLKQFYYNGGNMRLIVSPLFSKEDYEAIELGYKAQEDIAAQRIVEMFNIDEIKDDDGANILSWLIFEKRLDIRVVVKKEKNKKAIFHDKFSVLIDEEGNRITFRGSMNESETAMVDNYESIEVDCSWETEGLRRAIQREKQFDAIWDDDSNKWSTIPIPDAVKESLVQIRRPIKADTYEYVENSPQLVCEPETVYMPSRPAIPKWLELRKYQKNAIAAWVKNNNRGIFQMATGTGKTKTSLAAVTKILDVYYSNQVKCGLVVVVPYVVLLEQWLEDLKEFQISAIACYESKNKWLPRVEENIRLFNENVRDKLFLITTTKTLISSDFQRCIASIKGDYIFLADEMHHLTSDMMRQSLPQNAKYRLGLSATLMTKYNSAKMEELKAYFGGIIYEYSMKEAIETDCLTRYFYYPIYVELTDEEKSDYYEVSKKISKAMMLAGNDLDDDDNIPLKALLSQRGRILASASNKLIKLKEMAPQFKDKANLIIYCGDKIESNVKYIDKVYEIVNNEEGIISAKFTAEENPQQRRDILDLFGKKVIQALIAIRCLDEGVDIPQLETAIIMSSGTNPKEFIQRRGRILRKAAGKQYSYIYDFIVIPSLSIQDVSALTPDEKEMELKVISREFERVQEFANLAENGLEVTASFLEKWRQYSGGMDNA
jgi:superfamily II DNA or RNA helicase